MRRHGTWIACFLLCVVAAYAMRSHHFSLEARKFGEFVPFTLESAMMYSYALEVAETGGIPTFDKRLVGMEDVEVRRQMSLGIEYFLGYGYRLRNTLLCKKIDPEATGNEYEYNPDFTQWIRFQIRLWISLGAGFVFLWLAVLGCRLPTAVLGGFLFAVAPAAVARATGQDLIMENFTMPLILASMAFYHLTLRRGGRLAAAALFVAVYLALATWDMCQLCFGLFGIWELLRLLFGGTVSSKRRIALLTVIFASFAAGLTVPYLQTHRFLCSPMMTIVFPALLCLLLLPKNLSRRGAYVMIPLLVVFAALWFFVWKGYGYGGAYDHFWSLLKAKIRYLNVKPADPALLDYDSRMLWTPALHSASVRETLYLFGNICVAFAATALLLLWSWGRRSLARDMPRLGLPLFMSAAFCVLYVFMVRFHALAIPFLCVLLALIFDKLSRLPVKRAAAAIIPLAVFQFPALLLLLAIAFGSTATGLGYAFFVLIGILGAVAALLLLVGVISRLLWAKIPWASRWPGSLGVLAFLLVVAIETEWSGSLAEGVGRQYEGEYLKAKAELVKWFRSEGMEEKTILTDFTMSPMLKAYCRARIVLQPKFELGRTRDMVKEYLDIVYHGNEQSLNAYCVRNGVRYYVFDNGLAGAPHIYSSRYIAGAVNLKERSPARRFFAEPDSLRLFYRLDPPFGVSKDFAKKFTVFQVITPDDHGRAVQFLKDAEQLLADGKMERATFLVKAAVYADPNLEPARILYAQVFGHAPDIRLRGY